MKKRGLFLSVMFVSVAAVILAVSITFAWLTAANAGDDQFFGTGGIKVTLTPKNSAYIAEGYKYLPGDELVNSTLHESSRIKPGFNMNAAYTVDQPCYMRVNITYYNVPIDDEGAELPATAARQAAIMPASKNVADLADRTPLVVAKLSSDFYAAAGAENYWYYKGAEVTNTEKQITGTATLSNIFELLVLNGEPIVKTTGKIYITITVAVRQAHSEVTWNNYTQTIGMG